MESINTNDLISGKEKITKGNNFFLKTAENSKIYREYKDVMNLCLKTENDYATTNLETLILSMNSISSSPEKEIKMSTEKKEHKKMTSLEFNKKTNFFSKSANKKVGAKEKKRSYWSILKELEKNKEVYLKSEEANKIVYVDKLTDMYKKYAVNLTDYLLKNKNNLEFLENKIYKTIQTRDCNYSLASYSLTPIPAKRLIKNKTEKEEIFNMERSAVVMRRIEYALSLSDQNEDESNTLTQMNYFTDDEIMNILTHCSIIIQNWWRLQHKINLYKKQVCCKYFLLFIKKKNCLNKVRKSVTHINSFFSRSLKIPFDCIKHTRTYNKVVLSNTVYYTKMYYNDFQLKKIKAIQKCWRKHSVDLSEKKNYYMPIFIRIQRKWKIRKQSKELLLNNRKVVKKIDSLYITKSIRNNFIEFCSSKIRKSLKSHKTNLIQSREEEKKANEDKLFSLAREKKFKRLSHIFQNIDDFKSNAKKNRLTLYFTKWVNRKEFVIVTFACSLISQPIIYTSSVKNFAISSLNIQTKRVNSNSLQ